MKELINILKNHIKDDFHFSGYLYIFIFTGLALGFNYYLDFEHAYINQYFGEPEGILIYVLFYSFSYYGAAIPFLLIKKQAYKLKKIEFWVKSFAFISILGIMAGFYYYRNFAELFKENPFERYYIIRLSVRIKHFIPYVIVLFIIKMIYDRNVAFFYGLRFGGISYKPFFILLILIIPLVVFASFLESFQDAYPQFPYWRFPEVFGLNKTKMMLIFESFYTVSFVSTELIFRGALVIAMISVLGKESVILMAT
jgi:hypothetical protein